MFPWSPEFTWDAWHVAFFGALYGVLTAVGATLALALWRARRDLRERRAAAIAWHGDFEEMEPAARACRHQLTGAAPGRTCPNAFDCRHCADHPRYAALEPVSDGHGTAAAAGAEARFGFDLPLDRLYHRGHTWVRPEPDGTLVVGLDDFARRLFGTPDSVELPAVGERIELGGSAARVTTRGREVRVLAPVDGTVVAAESDGAGFTLRVDPGGPADVRHLLAGNEVAAWALRELERVQQALGPRTLGPALADGGELVRDLGAALPAADYEALLGQMLLEP
jgi:glycine cleavage system H protein